MDVFNGGLKYAMVKTPNYFPWVLDDHTPFHSVDIECRTTCAHSKHAFINSQDLVCMPRLQNWWIDTCLVWNVLTCCGMSILSWLVKLTFHSLSVTLLSYPGNPKNSPWNRIEGSSPILELGIEAQCLSQDICRFQGKVPAKPSQTISWCIILVNRQTQQTSGQNVSKSLSPKYIQISKLAPTFRSLAYLHHMQVSSGFID